MQFRILLAVASTLAVTLSASASPWTNPTGKLPGIFEYWNGGDINGKYGDPAVSYNPATRELNLIFNPDVFRAESIDGIGDPVQATDTVSVDIKMHSSLAPAVFTVRDGGTLAINGTGTAINQSMFTLTELSGSDPLNPVLGTPRDFPLLFQPNFPLQGAWVSTAVVDTAFDLGRDDFVYFRIELLNLLEATSAPGSSASIDKLGSEIELTIKLLPEPTTLSLLGFGLLVALRRR